MRQKAPLASHIRQKLIEDSMMVEVETNLKIA